MFTSSHYNKKFFFLLLFLSGFIGTIIPFLNNCLLSSDKLISIYVGTIYISILLYCVLLISFRALVKILINPIYLFLVFLSAFYLSGIIGISDYRGYINIGFWLRLLITSVASFYFGTILYNFLNRINFKKKNTINNFSPNLLIVKALLCISFLVGLYSIFTNGFLIFKPNERFNVNPYIQYFVEMSIPLTIIDCVDKMKKGGISFKTFISPIFSFFILLSLGYRNQPMLLLLGILLTFVFYYKNNVVKLLRKKKLTIIILLNFSVILFSLMFINRQQNSDNLLDINRLTSYYDFAFPEFTLPIIPFHMASREAMGVTEIALERKSNIESIMPIKHLFFADLLTLLPGKQITAGNILGIVVNRNPNVSLTVGILGGLYLSYNIIGIIIFFFIIGYFMKRLTVNYFVQNNYWALVYLINLTIYLIEFTNRGLFKPMYIFTFVLIYGIKKLSTRSS